MPVLLISPDTGTAHQADVVIDTGAEVSIFDPSVAEALGLDLAGAARVKYPGNWRHNKSFDASHNY